METVTKMSTVCRLYTFSDSRFARLKQRFNETFADDFEVLHIDFSDFASAAGDTRYGGVDVWLQKTQMILKALRENRGSAIIICDVDIQFFAPTRPLVEEALACHDIVFQEDPEGGDTDINIGFMAMHCVPEVERLWELAYQRIQASGRHDQLVVAEILGCCRRGSRQPELAINYGFFPRRIWAYGGTANWNTRMPSNLCLHHATWVSGETRKLRQMATVRRRYRHPWTFQLEIPWMWAQAVVATRDWQAIIPGIFRLARRMRRKRSADN